MAILVAITVNGDGYREVLGAVEGMKEDKTSWGNFFQWLRGRSLDGAKLVVERQAPWNAGGRGSGVPRGQIPAVHRPLLPQCVFSDVSL